MSDDEAKNLYLTRILTDLRAGNAFVPSSPRGSEADRKRWRDSAARSWGGYLPAARCYDPANTPGFAQWLTGMTTRGFKTRTNPSGRRVPYGYPEPEEIGRAGEMPGIKFSIDAPSQEIADEKINSSYRSGTPEANAAVQQELEKPARDMVGWLKRQGWIDDSAKVDDYVQMVVMGMMNRTGALCSHLLFTYSKQLSATFHIQAVIEMYRVAREIRIFPLLDMNGQPSRHVPAVCEVLNGQG